MKEFSNIEAVILDKDGVFVDFHKLWLRVIAYRAQLIAEAAADNSDSLVKIRTACIRAMGVDEDLELVDPYGPCSMPLSSVRLALATAVFLLQNETDSAFTWEKSFYIIDRAILEASQTLNIPELSEAIDGSLEKIKELAGFGFKLAVYTSDSLINTQETLKKFQISSLIAAIQAGELKTADNYRSLCEEIGVRPENTLLITDSPVDLAAAKAADARVISLLSGIIDEQTIPRYVEDASDAILKSLADLELGPISDNKKKVAA